MRSAAQLGNAGGRGQSEGSPRRSAEVDGGAHDRSPPRSNLLLAGAARLGELARRRKSARARSSRQEPPRARGAITRSQEASGERHSISRWSDEVGGRSSQRTKGKSPSVTASILLPAPRVRGNQGHFGQMTRGPRFRVVQGGTRARSGARRSRAVGPAYLTRANIAGFFFRRTGARRWMRRKSAGSR